MSDSERLKTQMSQLGAKFIERTRGEVATAQELAQRARAGDGGALEQLNYLVHRIHGGGATFGFPDVGACAGEIEQMIEPAIRKGMTLDSAVLEQVVANCVRLEEAVRKANR